MTIDQKPFCQVTISQKVHLPNDNWAKDDRPEVNLPNEDWQKENLANDN